jgi:glutamate synthase (ferredoxin)
MTGGRVVVLGATGRNFAAGMSGGIAYVLDPDGSFALNCNIDMVDLERLEQPDDLRCVRDLVQQHVALTGSAIGNRVLQDWPAAIHRFVVVMPRDFKKARNAATNEATEAQRHGASIPFFQIEPPSLRVSVART